MVKKIRTHSLFLKLLGAACTALLMSGIPGCSLFEQDTSPGTLQITISHQADSSAAAKPQTVLHHLQCILKRGHATVHNKTYYSEGGYFQIIINDLVPSEDYSILLWGYNDSDELLGQGISENISVQADEITTVLLSWHSFTLSQLQPEDGDIFNDETPGFTWNSSGAASIFELEIDTVITYGSGAKQLIHVEETSYQAEQMPDGRYYWRLRCRDIYDNWTEWTKSFTFTIDTEGPPPPLLLEPVPGDTFTGGYMYLLWTEVEEAICYDLELSTSPEFSQTDVYIRELSDTLYYYRNYAGSMSNGTYYCRVCSVDSLGNRGEWSDPTMFVIAIPVPNPPNLLYPADGDSISNYETLYWSKPAFTNMSTLQIDTTAQFANPVLHVSNIYQTYYMMLDSLETNKWYYWRVKGRNFSSAYGDWSDISSFYIK